MNGKNEYDTLKNFGIMLTIPLQILINLIIKTYTKT